MANWDFPLRKAIAEKMTAENGIECGERIFMVTNGAGQALMSAVRCALNRERA